MKYDNSTCKEDPITRSQVKQLIITEIITYKREALACGARDNNFIYDIYHGKIRALNKILYAISGEYYSEEII